MTLVKISILLTATVNPKIVSVKRHDPITREKDYLGSLKSWVAKTTLPIVFVENSCYNIDKINDLIHNNRNIKGEVLQYDGQCFPGELGKGYGELLSIIYANNNSKLIEESDYVVKATGRYFINNFNRIINTLYVNSDTFIMANLRRYLTWADSRIFAYKPEFIDNYLGKYIDYINDSKGFWIEHALSRAICEAISDGKKWIPMSTRPHIIGVSGSTNEQLGLHFGRSLLYDVAHYMKNYLNKI
jgi:hypothetical protein